MKFLTFLSLEEIEKLTEFKDERINRAKEVLAYEVTKLVHSEEDAIQAQKEAKGAFGDGDCMPTATIEASNTKVVDILVALKLAPSKGEAKRLIMGGGIKVNDRKIAGIDDSITAEESAGFIIHKGKKAHIKVTLA